MFSVQPMFARFVLPLFGGTPAVWTTSMLFFQAGLLAGYLYAHAATSRFGVRRQAGAHLAVMLLPLVSLPLGVPAAAAPESGGDPVLRLLGVLLVGVGLPFFVVSTTAPLLQRWLAATRHPAAGDPYFLYRASNLGSIVGLLAYPLVVEPALRLAEQGATWAAGYLALVGLVAGCAVVMWRSPAASAPAASAPIEREAMFRRRLRWGLLAFAPSSLMLGVTSYATTDLSPIPLLWALPLSLYLLSFVLAFAPGDRNARRHRLAVRLFPLAAIVLSIALVLDAREPLWVLLPLHLAAFFVAALVCHGELARDRPPAARLTGFYMTIAVGGVLGGVVNALIAPLIFDSLAEYPLAIVLACLCLPTRPGRFPATDYAHWLDIGVPLAVGVLVAATLAVATAAGGEAEIVGRAFALSAAAGVVLNFARRPLRFGLSVGAILLAGALTAPGDPALHEERSFFGTHRVEARSGGFQALVHGTTIHGGQYRTPARRLEPVTYYHPSGPAGEAMSALPGAAASRRAAILGLGSGALACYARPDERFTFYEIDAAVERIARDDRLFTYLRDCPGRHDVVLGDARLSLREAPGGAFGLIVADVFSSDAIPVHTLTREALTLYESKLAPGGALLFHISNRYLDLEPVLAALARDARLACLTARETRRGGVRVPGKVPSRWVAMARAPDHLGGLRSNRRWRPCHAEPGVESWTDDFSNVVGAFDF